jgi:hypothetical protein
VQLSPTISNSLALKPFHGFKVCKTGTLRLLEFDRFGHANAFQRKKGSVARCEYFRSRFRLKNLGAKLRSTGVLLGTLCERRSASVGKNRN